jgi:hypothetical protein
MSNNDMNLSITEMMELILTGANGSEWAVEGVMRTAIDHIKKLEEQNKKLIDISKSLLQTFTPDKFVRVMMTHEQYDDIEYVIAEIEGEKK